MARRGTPLADFARLISWHRRKLAVLAAVGATVTGITAATPDPPPTSTVVVAARALAGGRQLTADDLTTRELPQQAVPSDAIRDPDQLLGRTLVAPLTTGSPLTAVSVLGNRPRLDNDTGDDTGMVIAPLRVADAAVVALLRVGDRVDVVASDPESGAARVIAEQIRVVTIPRTPADTSALSPGAADPETLLLVEVDREQATTLAEAAASSQISLLLR